MEQLWCRICYSNSTTAIIIVKQYAKKLLNVHIGDNSAQGLWKNT